MGFLLSGTNYLCPTFLFLIIDTFSKLSLYLLNKWIRNAPATLWPMKPSAFITFVCPIWSTSLEKEYLTWCNPLIGEWKHINQIKYVSKIFDTKVVAVEFVNTDKIIGVCLLTTWFYLKVRPKLFWKKMSPRWETKKIWVYQNLNIES